MNKFKFLAVMVLTTFCLMADKIGVVDLQKAVNSHPQLEEVLKEIREKQSELEKDLEAKQAEFGKIQNEIIEKGDSATREDKIKIMQMEEEFKKLVAEKKAELNRFSQSQTKPLQEDVFTAIPEIKKEKGLDIIFDKSLVIIGGEDITDEVIDFLSGLEKINME
jgi:Skp family chaperone for outer membrane proteins